MSGPDDTIDALSIDTIRTLAMDAVQQASSGHPGTPMAMAPVVYTLWQLPRFDLVFLGLGADGHTASLFPGSEVLAETERLVTAPWIARLKARRLTLTTRVLNHAACVVFLVSGDEKAVTLRQVLEGPRHQMELPSQSIEPGDGELLWLVDAAAARLLSPRFLRPQ